MTAANGEKNEMTDDAILDPKVPKKFIALVHEAEHGSQEALDSLTNIHPDKMDQVIRLSYGDLANNVLEELIQKKAGDNLIYAAGFKSQIAHMRSELTGPEPHLLETLLVDRILLTWIQAYSADRAAINAAGDSIKVLEYYERRQERAQKRFHQACKALAQVRRLMGPNIQVNIGEKQINVVDGRTE
jgi:hypothetical protein